MNDPTFVPNLVWDEHKLVVYAIHKAASSSVIAAFVLAAGGDLRYEKLCRNERFRWLTTDEVLNQCADYKRVVIVRNPFARLVSCYEYWVAKRGLKTSFRDYADMVLDDPTADSHSWPQTHQAKEPTFIGKLENIHTDWEELQKHIGMRLRPLEHRNKLKHEHYMRYYDHVSRDTVSKLYRDDLKTYDYTFEAGV